MKSRSIDVGGEKFTDGAAMEETDPDVAWYNGVLDSDM